MKLPENPELRKWVEKNLDRDAANTVFSTLNVEDGDLELKKKTLQCMIALMAVTKMGQERLARMIVGHTTLNLILLAVIFGVVI